MRRAALLLVAGSLLGGTGSIADAKHPLLELDRPLPVGGPAAAVSAAGRADTVWFGGDDGNGIALEDGLWDFEGPNGDFQGWSSMDLTENDTVFIGRVTFADFSADPCSPLFSGSEGQLWAGIHEVDANARDFITGMGYGNNFCQYAHSPKFGSGDVDVSFDYFTDTEIDFDYVRVGVLCFDSYGEPLPDGNLEIARLTGVAGSPEAPLYFVGGLPASTFPLGTDSVCIEVRVVSDVAWSDEDGFFDCACGPFSADDISITVGAANHTATFESGEDGYTFGRCVGIGAYLGLVSEATYIDWLDLAGLSCTCGLEGWALEMVDREGSPYPAPGHPPGQHEYLVSGIVDRTHLPPDEFNDTVVQWTQFSFLSLPFGCEYRPGYMYYPYTSEANPAAHWSPRMGHDSFLYTGASPNCYQRSTNLSTLNGLPGTLLPNDWEQLRFVYEIFCSCANFNIPTSVCVEEGNTAGTPVLDGVRVGLTHRPDAPPLTISSRGWYHDGFGQRYPHDVEPSDVGNSNVTYNLGDGEGSNDWLADSSVVEGPRVPESSDPWQVELCVHLARKGPRQDLIPEYLAWKARLSGDPETGFACILMDSTEVAGETWSWRFASYFHEDDPGFDPSFPDVGEEQEILPDLIWTPGTSIEYYYRSRWTSGGDPAEYFVSPLTPAQFEILPGMVAVPDQPYQIQWPAVLYINPDNPAGDYYVEPMLQLVGLDYDKYNYQKACACCFAPLARSFGGTHYNPGGYGNNGCTLEQLLGYRVILVDAGEYCGSFMRPADWALLEEWLLFEGCGLDGRRRGLVLTGDGMAQNLQDYGGGPAFLADILGATLVADDLGDYGGVPDWCLRFAPSVSAAYDVSEALRLYGNGCPVRFPFDVLGLSGAAGAVGNLDYSDGGGVWPLASVVRDRVVPGVSSWRTVLTGFGLQHLSANGCAGMQCATDSACIVQAGGDWLAATIAWLEDPGDPFVMWRDPCETVAVDEEPVGHLVGSCTYLYSVRPNPIHGTSAIRFSLAADARVRLQVFDAGGRCVRTLVDEWLAGKREHAVTWEGSGTGGMRLPAGVYWLQLSTADGFRSSHRLVVMR